MRFETILFVTSSTFLVCAPAALARADAAITLPPGDSTEAGAGVSTASRTHLGGYAELHYGLGWQDDFAARTAELDLHRLVLFVGHDYDERLRFFSEIEIEHTNEVGIEQAYVDYALFVGDVGDRLALRAGIVLVPLGIVNQWHEPTVFHGVERPTVDRRILPTTWREGGVGVAGRLGGLRVQLYFVGGLDAGGFSAGNALRGGRQAVAEAKARGLAVTGRVEWEPTLGAVGGAAGYAGLAGPNATLYGPSPAPGQDGRRRNLDVPVAVGALDARWIRGALETRAALAWGVIGQSAELSTAFLAPDSTSPVGAVGAAFLGLYGEVAYDVLAHTGSTHRVFAFARVEYYDTMAGVAPGVTDDPTRASTDVIAGISFRPHASVVFKSDFAWRAPGGSAPAQKTFGLGVGLTY